MGPLVVFDYVALFFEAPDRALYPLAHSAIIHRSRLSCEEGQNMAFLLRGLSQNPIVEVPL